MKPILFCLAMLLNFVSFGQAEQFRVISCSGDVSHQVNSQKKVRVVPGASIKPEGVLIVGSNSKVKMICSDKPQVIDAEGEYNLTDLYNDGTSKSISFTGKFWNFIMDGLKKSDTEEDLVEYHKEYMAVSGGVKGYSPYENDLYFSAPFSGKLETSIVELTWEDLENEGTYNISVRIEDGSAQVLTVPLKSPTYKLDLSKYGVKQGQQAFISVMHEAGYKNELRLIYEPLNQKKIDRKLSTLIDYENGSDKEKAWMQATIYEMEEYNTKASEMYQQLLVDYPEDGYIMKLNHLFLVRTNQMKKLSLSIDK